LPQKTPNISRRIFPHTLHRPTQFQKWIRKPEFPRISREERLHEGKD